MIAVESGIPPSRLMQEDPDDIDAMFDYLIWRANQGKRSSVEL